MPRKDYEVGTENGGMAYKSSYANKLVYCHHRNKVSKTIQTYLEICLYVTCSELTSCLAVSGSENHHHHLDALPRLLLYRVWVLK